MADTDPDELERKIERTRAELARTVDAIADRVSPKRVAQRGVARAKENAETLLATVSAKVGDAIGDLMAALPAPADGKPRDPWEERERARRLAPVVIGVGAALAVGAAIVLWRRRRR